MMKSQTLWIALLCALGAVLTFSTGENPAALTKPLQKDCVECARRFPAMLPGNPVTVDEAIPLTPKKDAKQKDSPQIRD